VLLAEVRTTCEPLGAKPTLEKVAVLEQQLAAEIAEDLRAALEEFETILADLGAVTD